MLIRIAVQFTQTIINDSVNLFLFILLIIILYNKTTPQSTDKTETEINQNTVKKYLMHYYGIKLLNLYRFNL